MFATFSALRKRLTGYVFSRRGTALSAGPMPKKENAGTKKPSNSKVKNGRVGKTSSNDKTKQSAIKEKLKHDYKMSGALDDIDEDEVKVVFNDDDDTLVTDAPDPDDLMKDPTLVPDDELSSESDDLVGTRSPRLSSVERGAHFLNIETERTQRQKALESIAHGDWTASEIELFNKLNLRGFEPLFPASWQAEFTTCPDTLFTEYATEWFISSNYQTKFRGKSVLSYPFLPNTSSRTDES
ncbi:MAG: hypothetical protein Q9187_007465 [Circinaria calcarea]